MHICPGYRAELSTHRLNSRSDPRLLRESPEILAASNWLQSPTGKMAAYSVGGIHGIVGAVVAILGHTETAVRILATGDGCLGCISALTFWYMGKFLLAAIDKSLLRNTAPEQDSAGGRDSALLKARKKVVRVISFFVQQCIMGSSMLLFSAHSKYGTEAPLLLFCVPFTMPVAWNMVCTQLFAGRSKLRGSSVGSPITGVLSKPTSPTLVKRWYSRSHHQVVPTEASVAPC